MTYSQRIGTEGDYLRSLDMRNNNKMDVKELLCENVDWIQLALGGVQWQDPMSIKINSRCL